MPPRTPASGRTRTVLAAAGLALLTIAGVWLLGPWHSESALPMVVCLKPHDVACSDDFLFGRDRTEDLGYLVFGSLAALGAVALLASVVWTARTRSSARTATRDPSLPRR